MQNWDSMQTTASNQLEHNNWYNNMFAANIKTEPGTQQHTAAAAASSQLETYLKQQQEQENYLKHQQQQQQQPPQQQQFTPMDTNMTTTALTPSPPTNNQILANSNSEQHQPQQYFDTTAGMHHQLMQQQQYQQHFQQAQQAAAQNKATSHLPLGFNPLTPPGLPQAVLPPAMSHFYNQTTQKPPRNQQQTPSPQTTLIENSEKATLTPSHTPPMDITPPKSPKALNPPPISHEHQQDQELMSNSSEDLKYIVESDDDETIRLPIYNSHGKMKNYKCKSCGMVAITKLVFWEHAKTHMKPEKVLQCSKCPFVTELKHHLEYHIRKHKNLKPFQCDKCSYSCVNKSMLNSHRKSHSSVYQYRCADCDYATKYCHSFKLHLRKYDHKPGMVLDEEGLPNPSIVIDVYGTRRGPKNKGCSGSSMRKSNTDLKLNTSSQLSAALQGFAKQQMPHSPKKNSAAVNPDLPALSIGLQPPQPASNGQISPAHQISQVANTANGSLSNILPPLASLLQQNHNMAFFPYWNLNLQVLAAQQQAAVLAQLSPSMREQLQKYQNNEQNNENQFPKEMDKSDDEEDTEQVEEDDQDFDGKSVDSAMDLSQGTPTKDEQNKIQTPESAINLKLPEDNVETPLYSSLTNQRRKGRVLKLDQEQLKHNDLNSAPTSPEVNNKIDIPNVSAASKPPPASKNEDSSSSSAEEIMETSGLQPSNNNPSNTSNTSAASSSGNSSNSSSAASNSNISTNNSHASATPTMYECKYCDIFFKDAVLYTIHMGYHSCDDVFKCNMCGEKCDGPVGLFVHMARNAHS